MPFALQVLRHEAKPHMSKDWHRGNTPARRLDGMLQLDPLALLNCIRVFTRDNKATFGIHPQEALHTDW